MYLRGSVNILKRVLIHVAALNLGLLMRVLVGVGTPRSLQGRLGALVSSLLMLWRRVPNVNVPRWCAFTSGPAVIILTPLSSIPEFRCLDETTLTTDC